MQIKHIAASASAVLSLSGLALAPITASASGPSLWLNLNPPAKHKEMSNALSFSSVYAGDREMWHLILLVSAVVAIVGIVDNDSTLIILGAAGVVVSAVESGQMGFAYRPRHGLDLASMGSLSFGLNPLGSYYIPAPFVKAKPGLYLHATFRF